MRIDDRHFAARLQRYKHVDTVDVERHRARDAGIVEIESRGKVLAVVAEIDARGDRAHGALEVQIRPIAQRTALDVVLLRRHPGGRAVRRDDRRAEIVRDTAALVFEIRQIAVLQDDRTQYAHAACIDAHYLATVVHRSVLGLYVCSFLARQARSDKARDQQRIAVSADRDMSGTGSYVGTPGLGAGRGARLENAAEGRDNDVAQPATRRW